MTTRTLVISEACAAELRRALGPASAPAVPPPPVLVPPPPPAPVAVPGQFFLDLPWITTSTDGSTPSPRRTTSGFGSKDVLVVQITPPAGASSSGAGSVGFAEWVGGPYVRLAVISTTPGDFRLDPLAYNFKIASSVRIPLQVGGAQVPGIFCMQPGVPYYVNVKNEDQYGRTTVPPGEVSNLSIDFVKPPGT